MHCSIERVAMAGPWRYQMTAQGTGKIEGFGKRNYINNIDNVDISLSTGSHLGVVETRPLSPRLSYSPPSHYSTGTPGHITDPFEDNTVSGEGVVL